MSSSAITTRGSRVEELQDAARRAGLRAGPLTLATAERRRRRLWLIAVGAVVVASLAAAAVPLAESNDGDNAVWPLWIAVAATVAFAIADVLITERRLDRLTRLLLDEGIALGVEASRASELAALVDAGHALNGDLDLIGALDVILGRAHELVGGDSGSVMLLEGRKRLRVVCVQGTTDVLGAVTELGDGVAGRVAADRRPLRMSGLPEREQLDLLADRRLALESAMSLPLVHRGELIGVINVNAPAARQFTDHDLLLVSVLADLAAVAVAVARISEEGRAGAAVTGAVTALRDLIPRAGALADDLRSLAVALDTELPPVSVADVDVGAVARAVAARRTTAGERVHVHAAPVAIARADPVALDEVVDRLVTAAHQRGGAAEIEVDVLDAAGGGTVRLTVLDRGTALAADPFEPFGAAGYGLAVAQRLTAAQGGTITARSRAGGGSAVSVVLPVAPGS